MYVDEYSFKAEYCKKKKLIKKIEAQLNEHHPQMKMTIESMVKFGGKKNCIQQSRGTFYQSYRT